MTDRKRERKRGKPGHEGKPRKTLVLCVVSIGFVLTRGTSHAAASVDVERLSSPRIEETRVLDETCQFAVARAPLGIIRFSRHAVNHAMTDGGRRSLLRCIVNYNPVRDTQDY